MMDILKELYEERDRINRTIEAYTRGTGIEEESPRVIRKRSGVSTRNITDETRRKIAEAQRRRWDRVKQAEEQPSNVMSIPQTPQQEALPSIENAPDVSQTYEPEPDHSQETKEGSTTKKKRHPKPKRSR